MISSKFFAKDVSFSIPLNRTADREDNASTLGGTFRGGPLMMKLLRKRKQRVIEGVEKEVDREAAYESPLLVESKKSLLPSVHASYRSPTPKKSSVLWKPSSKISWPSTYKHEEGLYASKLVHLDAKFQEISVLCDLLNQDEANYRPILIRTSVAMHLLFEIESHFLKLAPSDPKGNSSIDYQDSPQPMVQTLVGVLARSINHRLDIETTRALVRSPKTSHSLVNSSLSSIMKTISFAEETYQLSRHYSEAVEFEPEVMTFLKDLETSKIMEARILTRTADKWKKTIRNVMFRRWKQALEGEKLARENLSRWLGKMVGVKAKHIFDAWKQYNARSKKNNEIGMAADAVSKLKTSARKYKTLLKRIEQRQRTVESMKRMLRLHEEEVVKEEAELDNPASQPHIQSLIAYNLSRSAQLFHSGLIYQTSIYGIEQIKRHDFGAMKLPMQFLSEESRSLTLDERKSYFQTKDEDDWEEEEAMDDDICLSETTAGSIMFSLLGTTLEWNENETKFSEGYFGTLQSRKQFNAHIAPGNKTIDDFHFPSFIGLYHLCVPKPENRSKADPVFETLKDICLACSTKTEPIGKYIENVAHDEKAAEKKAGKKTFAVVEGEQIVLNPTLRRLKCAMILQIFQLHGSRLLTDKHEAGNAFWGSYKSTTGVCEMSYPDVTLSLFDMNQSLQTILRTIVELQLDLTNEESAVLYKLSADILKHIKTLDTVCHDLIASTYAHRVDERLNFKLLLDACQTHLWESLRPHLMSREITDEEDQDDGTFTCLDKSNLGDLFKQLRSYSTGYVGIEEDEQVEELASISSYLRVNLRTTKRMFTYYAGQTVGGSNVTMDKAEYFRFIKDCKLNKLSKQNLSSIFQNVTRAVTNRQTKADDVADSPIKELSGKGFLEVLLRIGCLKMKKQNVPLSEKIIMLFEDYLIPNAGRIDSDSFRGKVMTPGATQVFKRFDNFLKDIFAIYAAMDQTNDNASNVRTINETEFVKLVRDLGLMNTNMTEKSTRNVFAYVQADVEDANVSGDTDNTTSEMVYAEFLEAVGAMAALHNPDPYLPLPYRIERYIIEVFKPAALKAVNMNLAKSRRKNVS
jgi:hypothetical protein